MSGFWWPSILVSRVTTPQRQSFEQKCFMNGPITNIYILSDPTVGHIPYTEHLISYDGIWNFHGFFSPDSSHDSHTFPMFLPMIFLWCFHTFPMFLPILFACFFPWFSHDFAMIFLCSEPIPATSLRLRSKAGFPGPRTLALGERLAGSGGRGERSPPFVPSVFPLWIAQMVHRAGIFTYIYPINDPNVSKYTIHGSSGLDHFLKLMSK